MRISSISGVHIKEIGDSFFAVLDNFLSHKFVTSSDLIVLNGDIFDILIGGKSQYLNKYEDFFLKIKELTDSGSKIVYIEGNHDFHIQKVILKAQKKFGISGDKFIHAKNNFSVTTPEGEIEFTHGDDIEIENEKYKSYKRKINNPLVKFLGDYVVPFTLIEWIGHTASGNSREKNEKKYELTKEGQDFVKNKFRRSADLYFERNSDKLGLVCGHSHCKDFYEINSKHYYINNGYAPKSKSFIYIDSEGPRFIDL